MFSNLLRAGFCSLALLLCVAGSNPAVASDPCVSYKKVVCYEQHTTYVTKYQSYTKAVTAYDSYGCPYTAYKTCYRTVQVPVVETVRVIKYVPVYGY